MFARNPTVLHGIHNPVTKPNLKHLQSSNAQLLRLLCNVSLWRALSLVQWPLGRLLAALLLVGKPVYQIAQEIRAIRRRLVGWLLTPPRNPRLRRLGGELFQLRKWHLVAAAAAATAAAAKLAMVWRDARDPRVQRKRALLAKQAAALCYEEWVELAVQLDELDGIDRMTRWRQETRLYDRKLLCKRLRHLRGVRERGDIEEMLFAVRADLIRNLGNITNSELHESFPRVPEPIQEYIKEVQAALHFITSYSDPDLSAEEKLNFLRETRHAFGRTALVLSGGGGLGAFHLGVVKVLLDHKLLPRVLSGSSVGSIVCAILGTYKDEELREMFGRLHEFEMTFFSSSTPTDFFRHLLFKGTLHDHEVLTARLRKLYGDLTFLEAYQRTGRILNVVVTAADTNEPPRLLNYLTAPHVLVWSAVACSSAFPYLYAPQDLWARNHRGELVKYNAEAMSDSQRRWRDGSLEEDLPMRGLSEMFNVNYYIVSQTNPHIVPLLSLKRRLPRTVYRLLESEFKHRCTQAVELVSSKGLRYLAKLFNQPWEGDITMMLPPGFNTLLRAICNPERQDLEAFIQAGQLSTYAKLSAIECNCAIEMTLDECLARVAGELQGRAKAKHRRVHPRIPSWVNLKSLGIPSVSSAESIGGLDANHNNLSSNSLGGFSGSGAPGGGGPGSGIPGVTVGARFPAHTIEEDESHCGDTNSSPDGADYAAAEYTGPPELGPEYPGWAPFDCCDPSTNMWETLLPLVSNNVSTMGLDFIST